MMICIDYFPTKDNIPIGEIIHLLNNFFFNAAICLVVRYPPTIHFVLYDRYLD